MGRRKRKSPEQRAKEEMQEIIDAMNFFGIPPDAQQHIVYGCYKYVRQSYGQIELMKMIWGEDWEPPVQDE